MIEERDLDGIPVLVTPHAGPTRAGLTFRVGRADETLAGSGITHLIEHLALHRMGRTDYHYNGATGSVLTHFHSQGSPEDVVAFLNGVCAALTDLPLDRLEHEREIQRTEQSTRTRSVAEPLFMWRYGARGYGLTSYPEWGLNRLGADDVLAWAARFFNRDNVMLWVVGDVPPGLRLDLPSGQRAPIPAPTSALSTTPAFFVGPPKVVVFDTVVRRRPAAQVYAHVLERLLFKALRQDGGYSYTASADYDPRGDDLASIVALVDALPDKQGAALGGMVDVLAQLRVGRIDEADVDATRRMARDACQHPEFDAARLPSLALNVLTGERIRPADEIERDVEAVTVADVHEVAVEASAAALLMVPDGHTADWAGFEAAPTNSANAVSGREFTMHNRPECRLIIGQHGASTVAGSTNATVYFGQCEALLRFPDGGRVLVGQDGIMVRVEPTLYPVDAAVLAGLDAAVPPDRHVPLPPRDAEAIPARPGPLPKAKAAQPAGVRRGPSTARVVFATLFLGTLCLGVFTLSGYGVYKFATGELTSSELVASLFFGAIGVILVRSLWMTHRAWRMARRA